MNNSVLHFPRYTNQMSNHFFTLKCSIFQLHPSLESVEWRQTWASSLVTAVSEWLGERSSKVNIISSPLSLISTSGPQTGHGPAELNKFILRFFLKTKYIRNYFQVSLLLFFLHLKYKIILFFQKKISLHT